MSYQDNKYPKEPPYEDEVVFFEDAVLRSNPKGIDRKAKVCPICNYPIHIRLISYPCQHIFCYECHQRKPLLCGVCGSLNSELKRVGDKETIYSCDVYCQKAFDSQEELDVHLENHRKLLQ